MKLSTIIKLLLVLALGAFVWFLVVSIQFPSRESDVAAQEDAQQLLRKELASRSENVHWVFGNIIIDAAVQETYKNGEIHFRDFSMTQENDERTLTVTGKLAQTMLSGSEVDFMEIEGREAGEDAVHLDFRRPGPEDQHS